MTNSFELTDPEEIVELLKTVYGSMQLTPSGEQDRLHLRQDTLGPVEIHRSIFTMRAQMDVDPMTALPFGTVRNGTAAMRGRRDETQFRAGDAVLATLPEPYTATVDDVDIDLVLIPVGLFALEVDLAPNRRPTPIHFTSTTPSTRQAADNWRAAFRYVRASVVGTPGALQPLVAGAAARLLIATSLASFPNNALRDPTPENRRDAHSGSFHRAVSFIDDNAHRNISASEIAAASYVNIRALQVAFRRHLDTTPMAYLRQVRLEYAHRELIDADPEVTSVAHVAARWGFANHSRFTASYRATFGIAPSYTLRERNSSANRWM
ncbi:helix-turn-helix transcriptional regulator [Micromonospora sp. NPDC047644]|uniref:helix-turn-helix transcriptional regulator n=1 Tax=Micromonospora sp. NPDC047644 TaxID=3157203 RepID=UPI003451C634